MGDAFGNHAWSLSRGFRAVYESMIVTYFGDSIVGDFFNRLAKKILENREKIMKVSGMNLVVSLTKFTIPKDEKCI